jgi:hypothetical protein
MSRYSVTRMVSDRHTKMSSNTIINQHRLNNDDKSTDEICCYTLADEKKELIPNAWLQLIDKESHFIQFESSLLAKTVSMESKRIRHDLHFILTCARLHRSSGIFRLMRYRTLTQMTAESNVEKDA